MPRCTVAWCRRWAHGPECSMAGGGNANPPCPPFSKGGKAEAALFLNLHREAYTSPTQLKERGTRTSPPLKKGAVVCAAGGGGICFSHETNCQALHHARVKAKALRASAGTISHEAVPGLPPLKKGVAVCAAGGGGICFSQETNCQALHHARVKAKALRASAGTISHEAVPGLPPLKKGVAVSAAGGGGICFSRDACRIPRRLPIQ
jgi:hypothetical protein